jgi:hypothetical protein
MITIHKTFSKKDIIKFMLDCGIFIDDNLNKDEVRYFLSNLFQKNFNIKINKYGYYRTRELLYHLRSNNNNKELKPSEKTQIVKIARKIIRLGKNHYSFIFSEYDNFEQVKSDCIQIYQYGYLASVRKAIKYYNFLNLDHINYLNHNDNVKKDIIFLFKKGNYIVNLD